MRNLKIACLQLELKKSNNFDLVKSKIIETSKENKDIDLFVLSELCIGGAGVEDKTFHLENYLDKFSALARTVNAWLIPGTFYEEVEGEVFNTAPIINPSGELVHKCRKMFPWLPYEKNVSLSNDACLFDMPGVGKLGVHICYDLWFPETSRMLALSGAEIIINPTLTPTKDREIETVMVRATAAQQQVFYVDVNSCGEQGCGHSVVCDPNGEVIHESAESEDVFTVDLDLDLTKAARENGIFGLGQPIKSFRDHEGFKNMYKVKDEDYLKSLGSMTENQIKEKNDEQ